MSGKPLSNEERTRWRQQIGTNPYVFVKAPDEAKADATVCLEAVRKDGLLLEHCGAQIRSNRLIVLEAVKENAEAVLFAEEKMLEDAEIVKTMVQQRGQLLRMASEELRGNLDLVLEVVHDLWFTAEYVADSLRYDETFWREVIEQDPETGWMAFSYAPIELRNDHELMMEAIRVDPMAFKFASDELRNDSEFVLEAVKVNWIALKHASNGVRKNATVVLEALSQDFEALQYASADLLADPDFALEAAGYHARAVARGGVSRALQDNKEWVMSAVQKNPVALVYLDDDHREDRSIVNRSMNGSLGLNTGPVKEVKEGEKPVITTTEPVYGKCSGQLWKVDDGSHKWAAGSMKLAMAAIKAEDDAAFEEEEKVLDLMLDCFGEDDPPGGRVVSQGRKKNGSKSKEQPAQKPPAARRLH